MAWGKVDDKLHASVKWRRASKGARALWTTALSWCSDQENDGEVPRDVLGMLDGNTRDAASLVSVGLWKELGSGAEQGWKFHNWNAYNPDSASVKAKREAESKGGKWGNHARWHAGKGVTVPECQFCNPDQVPESPPDQVPESPPNPPVPSRPVPTPYIEASPPSGTQKRAHQLPDTWRPTPDHHQRAKDSGIDLNREEMKFRNHALEKGRTAKSWNAAFTRWLINAEDYAHRDGRTPQQPTLSPWDKQYARGPE